MIKVSKEEYVKEIKKFLIEKNNYTSEQADELIEKYKDEINELMSLNMSPDGAGTAMMMGY